MMTSNSTGTDAGLRTSRSNQRAWIRLPSGRHLDLISPDPSAWTHGDLAIRLGRTFRWSGESSWPVPLSVAQHSLQVLEITRQMSEQPLTAGEALRELLHDAEEGFLGVDVISPLKVVLGSPFRQVSDRLTAAIWSRYDLPEWDAPSQVAHKWADRTSAASEAVHCVGWTVDEVRSVLGIQAPILSIDPLAARFDCDPWKPWPSDVAAERFLSTLQDLLNSRLDEETANVCQPLNPLGTPERCAAARQLITAELVAQAVEIQRNYWNFHPTPALPAGLQLVAFSDGVWIADATETCDLNRVTRFARVADSWPLYVNVGGRAY